VFFATLTNNPRNMGYIVIAVGERETKSAAERRIMLVLGHAKYRKFDKNLLNFGIVKEEGSQTRLYSLPTGAALPCDECETIYGRDLK
jgi:hypothetical protein